MSARGYALSPRHPALRRPRRVALVSGVGTGELAPASPTLGGHDNARVREGGRRRRSSPRPGCHGLAMVQVRQAWCTAPRGQTRTWGMLTKGSLCATSDPRALAGSLHRRAVSNHQAGKRSASQGARSVWQGGKTVKSYLSLPSNKVAVEGESHGL